MAAFFFLSGAALLGVCFVSRLAGRSLDGVEKAAWGLVAGWASATLLAYGLARASGGLSTATLYPLTVAMWLAAAGLSYRGLRRLAGAAPRPRWPSRYNGLLLVAAALAPVLRHLVSTRMLAAGGDGLYSGGASFYDLNFHAALASSFAYGDNFPPVYTPYPPEPLLYPFMPDFLTGVLLALGADHHAALSATAFPLLLAILVLVYTLSLRVTRSGPAATLASTMFMLSGGLGFVHAAADWRASGKSLRQFWDGLEHNYVSMWERGYHWGNVVTEYFLPQRASLFGVALTLVALACLARAWESWGVEEARGDVGVWDGWKSLLPAGLVAGVLPVFHTHSFLALVLMCGVLTLLRPRRAWAAFWAAACVLALPRLAELTGHVSAAEGFFRLRPGWMGRDSGNWPLYWAKNVGVPLLLALPAWLAAPRRWKLFYLAPCGLLALAFFVSLSPNEIDDLKLMYYWLLATCVLVGWWTATLWAKRWLRPLVCLLVVASTASGILALRREGLNRARVFDAEEVAAAAFVREKTAPDSLFLTAPVINQPVLSLAGRPVVRGFPAWLWSHGLDVREREADVRRAYAGAGDAADVVRRLRVSYIYVGAAEGREYDVDEAALAGSFPLVYESPSVRIYDARAAAGGGGRAAWAAALAAPYDFDDALGRDPAALFVDFPNLGYFVHRLYRVCYGRAPRFEEFMADVRELGAGLAARSPAWDATLAENRRRFVGRWVTRPEFAVVYSARSDAELADALDANARAAGGGGRASPHGRLREGAGRAEVVAAAAALHLPRGEYNSAFVLAHYFAYFRRNPDDPPDVDFGGHQFWLDWLNRTEDYGAVSRAFIESIEYRETEAGRRRKTVGDGK
jgi:hypothetical protein